jgi:predicted kinase
MRKWMRERLQRRKKKTEQKASEPAPPPLQPAYFDEAASATAEPAAKKTEPQKNEASELASQTSESRHFETPIREARPSETRTSDVRASETQASGAESLPMEKAKSAGGSARRSRRRRGGRGRGGRGREQAVAQAFAPAAAKGIIPEGSEAPSEAAVDVPAAAPLEAEPEAEVAAATAPAPSVPAAVPAAPARLPKGIVVLAIGLPGSGKSSWFKRHNVVPLSSDMVRTLLFDDVREQRYQDLVFSNLRSMLKARLIAKRPMNYVDATNLTPQERQHWIKLAKDYGYEVHAVFFDVPLEVCIERHQRRDRVVPEEVMRRMAAKLKPPSFAEGIAKITVVRVKKKED